MTYREIQCQQIFASSRGMLVQKSYLLDRIDSIISGFSGNRLSYKMLVLM